MIRPVAIVATAQTRLAPDPNALAPEMVFDVARAAVAASGIPRRAIGMTVSASSDMLEGRPFNFVRGLESLGAWPATRESHVEMDGAWAAYEAWIAIQSGDVDSALVVAWSKASEASLHHVLNARLDPFTLAPLGLDDVACAALQAGAYLARIGATVDLLDGAAAASRAAAARNDRLAAATDPGDDPVASPLRRRHLPAVVDGACAVVLAAEEVARRAGGTPAWIRGADHRTEPGALGHRDLSRSASASMAAERAVAGARVQVAEVGASYAHQVPMLIEALGLDGDVAVNPSGGPLAADPMMATGLIRLAEAAAQVTAAAGAHQVGGARTALAHAATGPAMQQNVVFLLEAG